MTAQVQLRYATASTRWDVWAETFADTGRGYAELLGMRLAGVIEDDGLGHFSFTCAGCDDLDELLAKSYTSRAGARAALVRHEKARHAR